MTHTDGLADFGDRSDNRRLTGPRRISRREAGEIVGGEFAASYAEAGDGALDRRGIAFDLDQIVHPGIMLHPNRRALERELPDLAIDRVRHPQSDALQDLDDGVAIRALGANLLAPLVAGLHACRSLPVEGRLGHTSGIPVHTDAHDFVATRQRSVGKVETPVEHAADELLASAGGVEPGEQRCGIGYDRLQLELDHDAAGGAKIADRTASVSDRSSNAAKAPHAISSFTE